MTINPTLARDEVTQQLFPYPEANETFLLRRKGIRFGAHPKAK